MLLKIARKLSHLLSDKAYVKLMYLHHFRKLPNLKNPKTFSERIQWLKLYNRKPEFTVMVDKFAVRQYIADELGEEYLIPLLGVWNSFDEIDFDKLPDQFVLKCTHDSGSVVICKDKDSFDIMAARKKLQSSLKRNAYWYGREWLYKNVQPRIIAEQYMEDYSGELIDYKFMCFNGKVKCIFTCTERFNTAGLKVTFFDLDWNQLPFKRHYPSSKQIIPKPVNFELMLSLAEKLSKDIPFIRVDFYEVNSRVYFSELTFYPGSGLEEFSPVEWDYKLGQWLTLPETEMKKCHKNKGYLSILQHH